MHHIFTHRTYGVSIAAFEAIILLSTEGALKVRIERKQQITHIIVLLCFSILSTGLMFQLKDALYRHNGESGQFTQVSLTEPIEMSFIPLHSDITSFDIGFSVVNGTEGYCRVTIWDQDTVVEELNYSLGEYSMGNFHIRDVDWKLKAGYQYRLVIEPIQMKGDIQLWLNINREQQLPEYGTIVRENETGQILAGIEYWSSFPDNSRRILFTGTFMALFMIVFYACSDIQKRHVKKRHM